MNIKDIGKSRETCFISSIVLSYITNKVNKSWDISKWDGKSKLYAIASISSPQINLVNMSYMIIEYKYDVNGKEDYPLFKNKKSAKKALKLFNHYLNGETKYLK